MVDWASFAPLLGAGSVVYISLSEWVMGQVGGVEEFHRDTSCC